MGLSPAQGLPRPCRPTNGTQLTLTNTLYNQVSGGALVPHDLGLIALHDNYRSLISLSVWPGPGRSWLLCFSDNS